MIISDYVFDVFGEKYVAELETNKVYRVSEQGTIHFTLESGKSYFLYTDGYNPIQDKFWKSVDWEHRCLHTTL